MNGSSYHGLSHQQQLGVGVGVGMGVGVGVGPMMDNQQGYHVLAHQAQQLAVDGSSYMGLNQHQQGLMGVDSSSYQGLNNPGMAMAGVAAGVVPGAGMMAGVPGGVGVGVVPGMGMAGGVGGLPGAMVAGMGAAAAGMVPQDAKMAYAWQHLKADCMQPKLNHIHKAVPALLEAHQAQQQAQQAALQQEGQPMSGIHPGIHPGIGIDGLELLHGRLQRDPRGSRSDPQMDHLRREREYRLGRQTSSEQEIQARLNELPMIVRQERYRRRLERQSSSEQEQASGQPSDKESTGRESVEKRSGTG